MIDDQTKKRVLELCSKPAALGGWLGLPYEEEGCIKFAAKVYQEMGIEADVEVLKQARHFRRVDEPQFGDAVVFQGAPFENNGYHIAVMIDDFRKAIQCNPATNGVGKIDISRHPFNVTFQAFYRHESVD